MRALTFFLLSASMLPLVGGCQADPDVVATTGSGGAPLFDGNLPLIDGCKEGRYQGYFGTVADADGGTQYLSLAGVMSFSLIETHHGESLQFGPNTTLKGTDPTSGSEFTAEVLTGTKCTAGAFEAELVNGIFTITGAQFPFSGLVKGEYLANGQAFVGTWEAGGPTGVAPLHGGWSGVWVSPQPME
jgi:hypothetical protein